MTREERYKAEAVELRRALDAVKWELQEALLDRDEARHWARFGWKTAEFYRGRRGLDTIVQPQFPDWLLEAVDE